MHLGRADGPTGVRVEHDHVAVGAQGERTLPRVHPSDARRPRGQHLDHARDREAASADALRVEHRKQRLEVRDTGRDAVEGKARRELRRARVRDVIGPDRVQSPLGEGGPHRRHVLAVAKRRLPHPKGGIRSGEPLAREIQVERPRLPEHARVTLPLAQRREGPLRGEVNEVHRRAGARRERDRLAHRGLLGLDGTALREMQDARASRGVQLRGSRRDDRVVLGVDGHQRSRVRGRT